MVAYSQSIRPGVTSTTRETPRPARVRVDLLRVSSEAEREMMRVKLSKEGKKLITPDLSLRTEYATFLKQPNAEIVKLLDVSCEGIEVAELPDPCKVGIPGFGSHYSLRRSNHFHKGLSDVRLRNGRLHTHGFLIQGLFVSLGDVPVEELSLTSKGISNLTRFIPDDLSVQAEAQLVQLDKGLSIGDYIYYRSIQLQKDHSYGIRLIAYKSKAKTLTVDPRVDLIAIFRVVAIEPDGSVTFVWRQLERRDAPKLRDQ